MSYHLSIIRCMGITRFPLNVFLLTMGMAGLGLQSCSTLETSKQQLQDFPTKPIEASSLSVPLSFEANQGQTDPQVKFLSRGPGYGLFLTPSEAVLTLRQAKPRQSEAAIQDMPRASAVLRMRLVGANPKPELTGETALPGKVHYFIGSNTKKWLKNSPTFAQIRYSDVYPGIDLVYYGKQRQLEYDFIVAPGKDPSVITINFQKSADSIELEPNGNLLLYTSHGIIRQQKPFIYQLINGKRQEISGGYSLKAAKHVGFQVAAYDPSRPLIIDPVLVFSTYFGGSSGDWINDIEVDSAKNVYLMGFTGSLDFPTENSFQTSNMGGLTAAETPFGTDVFVSKLSPDGSGLIYSTYLGGSGNEQGRAIAVDADGNAYLTGLTESTDFPTVHPFQGTKAGPGLQVDAFVTKLAPDGSALVYSTYLGGPRSDIGNGIAIDSMGSAYVGGTTTAINFPITANAFQKEIAGKLFLFEKEFESGKFEEIFVPSQDIFITRLSPDGAELIYSTFLGGTDNEYGGSIAITADGAAHVTGETLSTDFPLQNAFQDIFIGSPDPHPVPRDAFVTKLAPDGSALIFSSYLGGQETGHEIGVDVKVDSQDYVYVTGRTSSKDFPTLNPFQALLGGGYDAFVTKINSQGQMVNSTFLGGSDNDDGIGMALDSLGNIYLTGTTTSEDFPIKNPLQERKAGEEDAFIVKLIPDGSNPIFSTYFGGSEAELGRSVAVDRSGDIYVGGQTFSTNFPTKNPLQPTYGGERDAFIAKITSDHIVIDGCVTDVTNQLVGEQHTITELILQCVEGMENHGQFISCMDGLTNGLKKVGLISTQEKGAIMSCAGDAAIR